MPRMAQECDLLSFHLPANVSEEQMDEINRRFEETTFDEILETSLLDGRPVINCVATEVERGPVIEAIERVFPRSDFDWDFHPSVRPTRLGEKAVPLGPRGIRLARKIDQKGRVGLAFQCKVQIEPRHL